LLEDEAGMQRQGPVEAKAATQNAGKDQHPLRMRGSAERDFALDVDDFAAAQAHPRSDAARDAKGGAPESRDKEPVNLADRSAFGLDAGRSFRNLVEEAPIDAVAAAEFSGDSRLDLGRADDLPFGVGRELVGFAQHIGDRTYLDRHLAAIASKARGVFDDASDAVAVEGPELFAPDKGGNKARIEQHRLLSAHHAVIEMAAILHRSGNSSS
jgi:hypothetical protein